MLKDIVLVAIGGSLGAISRFLLDILWHANALTLLANILGCFLLGTLVMYVKLKNINNQWVKPLIQTGFLGAFTSFSVLSTYFYINIVSTSFSMMYFTFCLVAYFLLFLLGTIAAKVMVSATRV